MDFLIEESKVIRIDNNQRQILADCVLRLMSWMNQDLLNVIRSGDNSLPMPGEIAGLISPLSELQDRLYVPPDHQGGFVCENRLLPVLKQALAFFRRERAIEIENRKRQILDPELLNALDGQIRPIDALMAQDWFRDVEPTPIPSLINFISIQKADQTLSNRNIKLSDRIYDEKFHILQSPQLLLKDLQYYRSMCEMRGVPLVIAYIDIDDFKKFNQKHGNPKVDRNILPWFMEAIEAHLFCHGWAYRFGGDEYVIILPNMPSDYAVGFLQRLRDKIAALKYRDIEERTTISIGFCVVDPFSYFTNQELEERANSAMKFAKEQDGKNRIATYKNSNLSDEELTIIPN